MSDIHLTTIRYRGDHPEDYENEAYKPGDDDVESRGVDVTQESPYEDVELKNGKKEKPPSYDDVGQSRSGSYKFNSQEDTGATVDTDEDELDDENDNCCLQNIRNAQDRVFSCCKVHKKTFRRVFWIGILLLYFAYFGYAMYYERLSNEASIRLCWVTCLVAFLMLFNLFWHFCGAGIKEKCRPCTSKLAEHERLISWILITALFLAMIVFVFVDVFVNTKQPYNLVSGSGILIYILLFFIFSVSPAKVQWRAVAWGLGLQFLFAILILRWRGGFLAFEWLGARVSEFLDYTDVGAAFLFGDGFREHYFAFKVAWRPVVGGLGLQLLFAAVLLRWRAGLWAFQWLGDRVTELLRYSDVGSQFVFGDSYLDHFVVFQILPTIIFFSTAISILYYLGAMQVVVKYVALVMKFAMGTTAGESLNAAGNIFVGQTEAPLLIRPLLPDMTPSELHAVMTGGFATIAGGVLAAYIGFGVPANHLLSASVMSAPAALAMAKLLYPETRKSKTTTDHIKNLPKSEEVNLIAAASHGASTSIKLVANVAVNLIAFLSLLAFINTTLTWFGNRVGLYDPELTFELICSYVLYPFALIMGVELDDCRQVGELIGIKTFLNEFIAYDKLGKIIKNRQAFTDHIAVGGSWDYRTSNTFDIVLNPLPGHNETTLLPYGIISERSEAIATYALCGFANIGSIGIQLGGLGAMAPSRSGDLAKVAIRAMIAGNVACFMTACIAGLFYQG